MTEETKKSTFKEIVQFVYGWLKKISLQIFGGLFMEQKNGEKLWVASMGKVSFWIVFGHCLYIWNTTTEAVIEGVNTIMRGNVSDGELYILMTLVGYQGAKLGKATIVEGIAAFKGK